MDTINQIAGVLRSTVKMASAFTDSVRNKIGQDVSDQMILEVLKKSSPRSIEINKIVAKINIELNKGSSRNSRSRTSKRTMQIKTEKPSGKKQPATPPPAHSHSDPFSQKTIIDQIEEILLANWNRAEKEGFQPRRSKGPAFINAVHRYCDPRDATRRRVLHACKEIDAKDILLTSTLVADFIRAQE